MRDIGLVGGGLIAPERHRPHWRPDGMVDCAGCGDVFVFSGYCGDCERINAMLEAKRLEDIERTNRFQLIRAGQTEGEDRESVLENPVLAGLFGLGVLCACVAVLWYVPPVLARIGISLWRHGI